MNVIFLVLTILGLIIASSLLLFALVAGKKRLRNVLLIVIPLWILIYGVLLIGASFQSRKTYLPNKMAKQFCGFYLGCHLKASVTGIRKTERIGNLKAQGIFYIVKVKIANDSGSKTLAMTNPEALVIDESGRFYSRKEEAEKQLSQAAFIAFSQPVAPNGSFEKEIVFDVTDTARNLNLSLSDTHGINRLIETFLIGDEESLFHKPTLFIIEIDTTSMKDEEV